MSQEGDLKTIKWIVIAIWVLVLSICIFGCNHRAGTLTKYVDGELVEKVHFKHTMVLYWSKEHDFQASYHTNDTLIDVGVGSSFVKPDPNSIKATGGAIGEAGKVLVEGAVK